MGRTLKVHLLVKGVNPEIRAAVESVLPLDPDILVGDLGCEDDSADVCRRLGAAVTSVAGGDNSAARRSLVKKAGDGWHFYLEPWECLAWGHDAVAAAVAGEPAIYRPGVMDGDVITRPNRLWHTATGATFRHPVMETLAGGGRDVAAFLVSSGSPHADPAALGAWRDRSPLSPEPAYYMACASLRKRDWAGFLNFASTYLHQDRTEGMPAVMTRYYLAMVHLYALKDGPTAAGYLIPCVAARPTMSEFWCLLADVYYAGADYSRAEVLYRNAIDLGAGRPAGDGWPLEVSKYREYPERMAEACRAVTGAARQYSGVSTPRPVR